MISYAQNFEDVILYRLFGKRTGGFYIDVGAMDPTLHSVTRVFTELGFDGINIEPNPHFFQKLVDERPHQTNLNIAIGDSDGAQTFYVFADQGISTFETSIRNYFEQKGYTSFPHTVEVQTLAAVCEQWTRGRQIDFLKVDAEGWEPIVLKSADLQRFRPLVILAESIDPCSQKENWHTWEPHLLKHDYRFVYSDGINRFYLRAEDEHLSDHFRFPPNPFDGFEPAAVSLLTTQRDKEHKEKLELLARLAAVHEAANNARQSYDQLTIVGAVAEKLETAVQHLRDMEASRQTQEHLQAEIDRLSLELESARQTNQRHQQTASTLTQQLLDLRSRADAELRRQSQDMQSKAAAELTRQLQDLQSRADAELARQLQEVQSKADSDRLWVGRLSQEVVAMRSRLEALQARLNQVEEDALFTREQAAALQKRLDETWREKEQLRLALASH